MSIKKSSGKHEWAKNVFDIAEILRNTYHDFAHYNKKNPLNELLFILCSTKTTGVSYENTYLQFRRSFKNNARIVHATERELADSLASGGLQHIKAKFIHRIIQILVQRFGRPTLAPLKNYSDDECEEFLTHLPGIGKKIARCVMMYSLNRSVFPVDTHCWRISKRLGWIPTRPKNSTCSTKDMDGLQSLIPSELRYSLHVNLISLGRKVCTHRKAKCSVCPIANLCERLGVE